MAVNPNQITPAMQSVINQIRQGVAAYNNDNNTSIDPDVLVGIAAHESSFTNGLTNTNTNGTIDYGVCQINTVNAGGLDLNRLQNDPAYNAYWAASVYAKDLMTSHGDNNQALERYAGIGSPFASGLIDTVTQYAPSVVSPYNPGTNPANPAVNGESFIPLLHTASSYSPLLLDSPTIDYTSLFPDAIVNTNLDNTPWYSDTNLVTGNPKVRNSITPVVFEVLLHDRQDVYLPVSPAGATSSQQYPPLQIQLNASMKSFTVNFKHVMRPQRTRTGWHITMWGMQPDMIEGQCTTGVFMNQFGLTDFFSTADPGSDTLALLLSGFNVSGTNSEIIDSTISPTGTIPNNTINSIITQKTGNKNPQEAFRVAAQDAFVEFLSLFKMNGIRWFDNGDFQAESGSGKEKAKEQVDIDAWSPELAIDATQLNGRLNDVMSRGSVLMKFKGTTYMGYFKSLNWNQDATSPFQWTFSFVFQVERTLGFIFNPTT